VWDDEANWSLAIVQSLVPEKHGDAPSHDVELPALMLDERERALRCIRQTIVVVQRVKLPAGPPLPCTALPRVTLVARSAISPETHLLKLSSL
jgi:hypothetical protein